jgi:translation elongation factor EF-Tu-like GTPase
MASEVTYDIRAYITLLPTSQGGRSNSILSGYKPAFTFNTVKHYCGELTLVDTKELRPGQSAEAIIRLLPAITLRKNLKLNESFTIVEGNKAVGNGIILHEIDKKETELLEHSQG